MKIYIFIFLSTCCIFEQAHTSSTDWKEIIAIRHQIREIKSITDNILIPLKIVTYKKGTLEAYDCYKEADSKLAGVQQIGYSEVADCIKNSVKDIVAGILCAMNAQQTVRESSQTINSAAIKCLSNLNIEESACRRDKTRIHKPASEKSEPIIEVDIKEVV